jgi:hypothetical protein
MRRMRVRDFLFRLQRKEAGRMGAIVARESQTLLESNVRVH